MLVQIRFTSLLIIFGMLTTSCVKRRKELSIVTTLPETQLVAEDTITILPQGCVVNELSPDSLHLFRNDKEIVYKSDSLCLKLDWIKNGLDNVCIYLPDINNMNVDTVKEQDYGARIVVSSIHNNTSDTIIVNRDILFEALMKTYENPDSLVSSSEFDINRYYIGDFHVVECNQKSVTIELSMIIADTDVGEIYHYIHNKNNPDSIIVVGTTIPVSD